MDDRVPCKLGSVQDRFYCKVQYFSRLCLDIGGCDLLYRSLAGTSDIPRLLLQYTWTHWEHPVDVSKII